MFIFGVTGSFGTGKTTVSKMLVRLGAQIIDADKITHLILKTEKSVFQKIVLLFGSEILSKDSKQINRKKLAKKVFGHKRLLEKLCKIIHPKVILQIKNEIAKKKKFTSKAVVIDVPLLIEANLFSLVHKVIVVKAKETNQVERMKKKMKLSRSEILARIKNQIPLKKKIKVADYVIDNNANFSNTYRQVKDIWNKEILKK